MGDSKNRKVPQKQKTSNNSKRKSSSNQKENAPKREKTETIKPDPDDSIAMSKQLLLKKNNARMQRRTSSKPERICPNGKPIPSLSELEKMFEDSDDDDDQTPKTPIQKHRYTPATPEKQAPTNSNKDLILSSPSTINKITERLLGSIQNQNLPSPGELLEAAALLRDESPPRTPLILPPKKRKVPEFPYIVGCKDRPQVIHKPSTNFCKGGDDYGVEGSFENPEEQTSTKRAKKSRIPNYTKSIFNAHSDEIAERLIKDDAGDLSDASSDSNKTIEYDPIPLQNPRPLSFSPLPSTSTDKKTFEKNDELFNESLKEVNISKESTPKKADDVLNNDKSVSEVMENAVTKSTPIKTDVAIIKEESMLKIKDDKTIKEETDINEDDVQIVEIPYDTIEIEDISDKTLEIQSTASKAMDTDDIEIIEPVGLKVVKPKENNNITQNILDDDDCMIITSSETNSKNNPTNLSGATIVIDDEYSTINMEFDSFNDEPIEIIDVDDIIAENNTILHKWKKKNIGNTELNKINMVVDVPNTSMNMSTPQTTVTPSTALQTISTSTTASTTLSTGVTPSTTFLAPSSLTPNYNSNVTNRNSATNVHNNQMLTSVSQTSLAFQSILDDLYKTLQNRPNRCRNPLEVTEYSFRNKNPHNSQSNGEPNTYMNLSTPQTTVTPSMAVQATPTSTTSYGVNVSNQSSASNASHNQRQTSSANDERNKNTHNLQSNGHTEPKTYMNLSTPQTAVTPSMAVETTPISRPFSALVTPSTTSHNQRQTSSANDSQSATFHSILDDFFESLQNRPNNTRTIYSTGSRITSLLTSMVNRLETPRTTSNQRRRPRSNRVPRSTSNQTPTLTSNSIRTPSHPVNTPMTATTSVSQNPISSLQNVDSSQRDLVGLSKSSSHSETQQNRMTSPARSPIPTRNIGDCPICLDPLNTSNGIASTICGHVFCLSCIRASVKTNGKKCPTCRKALKGAGGGYHLLYL